MFPSLTPHRKSSRPVSARLQSALHGFTDSQIFVLYARAHGHTLLVILAASIAHISEIKIEDHATVVNIQRDHQICVHVSLIAIDHEVRILPEIPGAVSLA